MHMVARLVCTLTLTLADLATPDTMTMDIRPNHTIYINNLNEKIKKDGECQILTFPINFDFFLQRMWSVVVFNIS